VLQYPLAILKFTWSDTPWANGAPVGIAYDDAVLNRLYLPLEQEWGVAGYWRRGTFDLINLEGSEVFPWRALTNLPRPTPAMPRTREAVISQALQQAQAEGWPLGNFKGIVVVVAPGSPSQDAGALGGLQWPICLVQVGDSQFFCAHEMGHVLGFEHTLGPDPNRTPPVLTSYISLYCAMGEGAYAPPSPLPPNGPPAADGYWSGLAPFPAAASLCAFLPGFREDTRHVRQVGPLTPAFQRAQRLRARDLPQGGHPVALVVTAPGTIPGSRMLEEPDAPPAAWVIELRRPVSWDRGLGPPTPAGLVVHSLRPINEFTGAADFRLRACYEGVFPLDPALAVDLPWGDAPSGDADRRFGDLTLRVDAFAPDLSWAEITVGGSALARQGAVTADFGRPTEEVVVGQSEGVAQEVPIFLCGRGNFRYTLTSQVQVLRSTAVAYGYETPAFDWKVNGVAVPDLPGGILLNPDQITVPVICRTPLPTGGETVQPRTVDLRFQRVDNTLTLLCDPPVGNFDLEIEVRASEAAPGIPQPTPPSSAVGVARMVGLVLTYEPAYYEALDECINRVQDIDDRFSISTRPGPRRRFLLTDPTARRLVSLRLLQRDMEAAGHRVLAEQLAGVFAALRNRPG
jgi:hypothetical protein